MNPIVPFQEEGVITYEVTAIVDGGLVPAYEQYMRSRHIPDLLATGCFVAASFSRGEGNRYRIRYEAPGPDDLERYLAEHAERLRAHVHEHFPHGIRLSRETWTVLERWEQNGSPSA